MPTPFLELRLPESISEGSKGGPGFSTDVFESETGFEQRNSKWAKARCRYDISYGIRDRDDADIILDFFYNMHGRATGFRYKDWTDYQLNNGLIGLGDGVEDTFQIVKIYATGAATYTRDLKKIVASPAPVVTVAGVTKILTTDYTLNLDTGVIVFGGSDIPTSMQEVRVTCEFDVPVRFDIDQLMITSQTWEQESLEAIPLVEIRPLEM